jgi:hypothetical protein
MDRGPTPGQPDPPVGVFKGQTDSPGCLAVLDRRLVDTGKWTSLYLSRGAAVVLAYGSTERTKDVDAFVAQRNEVLDELQVRAGKEHRGRQARCDD